MLWGMSCSQDNTVIKFRHLGFSKAHCVWDVCYVDLQGINTCKVLWPSGTATIFACYVKYSNLYRSLPISYAT